MIENLLILLIGVAIGVGVTARLGRKRTGDREVRVQVHELESMTTALVAARRALAEVLMMLPYSWARSANGRDIEIRRTCEDAYSRVKMALGEENGHAPKGDDQKRAWL